MVFCELFFYKPRPIGVLKPLFKLGDKQINKQTNLSLNVATLIGRNEKYNCDNVTKTSNAPDSFHLGLKSRIYYSGASMVGISGMHFQKTKVLYLEIDFENRFVSMRSKTLQK